MIDITKQIAKCQKCNKFKHECIVFYNNKLGIALAACTKCIEKAESTTIIL